jgi:hypothetical protein
MSENQSLAPSATPEAAASVHFAGMVIQQTNMARMFLGYVPHPETGEKIRDLDAAKLFIDQLEMLEIKTKGNLDKHEDQLLKESLTNLRMAFVAAVEDKHASPKTTPPGTQAEPGQGQPAEAAAEDEPRKKFSKKY